MVVANSDMILKVNRHILPVKNELDHQYVFADTYYKQLHIGDDYWDAFVRIFSITGYTCNPTFTVDYRESAQNYVCKCYGTDFNGMPAISLIFENFDV
jgi:hypothetical protein